MLKTQSGKIKLALMLALTLLLSSCTLKSNTELTFADDFSGTRVMTLDFTTDSTDPHDGFSAIDETIKRNLPDGLEYSGLATVGNNATATFTMRFTSLEDYRNQISFLAQYSGIDAHPSVTLVPPDSPFVDGLYYDEIYTSFELLTWVYNALISDGIMTEDEFQQVQTAEGVNTLVGPGTNFRVEGDYLRTNDVVDNRFFSSEIYIKNLGDGSFQTTVNFFRDTAPSDSLLEKENAYIDGIDINGIVKDAEPSFGVYQRSLSFTSKDDVELSTQLDEIFLTSDALFFIDNVSKARDHLVSAISYAGTLDTSKIVKDQASKLFVSGPQDLAPTEVHTEFPDSLSSFDTVIITELEVPHFDTALEVVDSSTGKLTLSFEVPLAQAEILNDDIEETFTPDKSLGTLTHTDKDDIRNYVITIPKITEDNAKKVNTFIGGTVSISPAVDAQSGDYHVALKFSPQDFLEVAPGKNTATISLPKADSFVSDSASATKNTQWQLKNNTATLNDSTADIEFTMDANASESSSPISTTWIYIIAGIVVALIIVLVVIIVVVKKRKRSAATREQLATQQATAQQAAYYQQFGGGGQPPIDVTYAAAADAATPLADPGVALANSPGEIPAPTSELPAQYSPRPEEDESDFGLI